MATDKQEKFMTAILEGKNNVEAKQEAGYSEGTAPTLIKRSEGFQDLMVKAGISDEYLAMKHKKLLDSDIEGIATKNLDLAYKVKGHYAPEKQAVVVQTVSEEEVRRFLANV